jgi:hypothetical protein
MKSQSETEAHIHTLSPPYTYTAQFFAIYVKTSVKFTDGTPLLPNFGQHMNNFLQNGPSVSITSYVWYFHQPTILLLFQVLLLHCIIDIIFMVGLIL